MTPRPAETTRSFHKEVPTMPYQDHLIDRIQKSGAFFLPPGAITTESHLAAFFDVGRRTILDQMFHPEQGEGVAYVAVGSRRATTTDQVRAFLLTNAQARKSPRSKPCPDDPTSKPSE